MNLFLKYKHKTVLFSLIVIFIIYSSFGITNPWGNDHNGFLAKEKAHYAINYLKFGYKETKLEQMIFEGGSLDSYNKEYSYYVHHPMLISLLISSSFSIFGINEWALRIVPILINIGIIIFLYLFTKIYWNKNVAILSCFFAVFFPMFFFNRNLAAFELLALFFMCVTLYFYVKWLKTNKKRDFYWIFISFVIGTLSDWQFYFVVPVIILHYFIFIKKRHKNNKLLFLIPTAFLTFILYIGYVLLLTGSTKGTGTGGDLWGNLLLRMNMNENAWICNITIKMIIEHIIRDISNFYTPIFLIVPIIFSVFLIYKLLKKKKIEREILPFLLFLTYISWLFIFSHMYMACEYIVLFLIPSMAIFASLLINEAWILVRKKSNLLKIVFFVVLLAFVGYYLYKSYPLCKNYYNTNNLYLPLNDFFSKNKDNIIVSFGEDSSFYQLRPYLDTRIVREIKTKEKLGKILEDDVNFGYFFVKKGVPENEELMSYLTKNYPYEEMYNVQDEQYMIFSLKESTS